MMGNVSEDGRESAQGAPEATPEQIAAIHAAMMEELGIARKDTLPLEDMKGTKVHVDLEALDREKRAKDPRTLEFMIAQKNATAHSAWKNAVFDDVDKADLEIDKMNSGQSHRERLKAELEASSFFRDRYATRGGRGGQPAIGCGNYSTSRHEGRIDLDEVLARLGGPRPPRRENSSTRGTHRGSFAKSNKRRDNGPTSKPNLPSDNSHSANALLFAQTPTQHDRAGSARRGMQLPQLSKTSRSTNYGQGFVLASPEDFLAGSWASKSSGNVNDDRRDEIQLNNTTDGSYKPQTIEDKNKYETRVKSAAVLSIRSIDVQLPSESLSVGFPDENGSDVAHSATVQVANQVGESAVTIGSGTVCIKTVDKNPQVPKVIQIKVHQKVLLEEPLLECFEFEVDHCTISFLSGIEGRLTKWILTTPQPWIATSLAEALETLRCHPLDMFLADASTKDHNNDLAVTEEAENLITFTDEISPEPVSQFTRDLFSLMDDQLIEEAVKVINSKMKHKSPTVVVSDLTSGQISERREAKHTQNPAKNFRGLATSRYASETDHFFSRSAIFQKLPGSTATYIKEQVSKRAIEKAQNVTSDQKSIQISNRKPHIRYTIEELMHLKSLPYSWAKPALDPCVDSSARDNFRPIIRFPNSASAVPGTTPLDDLHTTCLDVPIVSGLEKPPMLPEAAPSKYANSRAEKSFQGLVTLEDPDPPDVKPFQELTTSKNPDKDVARPLQGLASSKCAGPLMATPRTSQAFGSMAESKPTNSAAATKSPVFGPTITDTQKQKQFQISTATEVNVVSSPKFPLVLKTIDCTEKDVVATPKSLTGLEQTEKDHSLVLGSLNSLRRCGSLISHMSKDSTETVKPRRPEPMVRLDRYHTEPSQSSATCGHQSILSVGSGASCESSVIAIEETSIQGEDGTWKKTMTALSEAFRGLTTGNSPTSFQAQTSDFVLFPDDSTKAGVETGHHMIPPYSSDMSKITEDSVASVSKPDPHDITSTSLLKPFKIPATRSQKQGLMSSKYANAVGNVPEDLKQTPQSLSAMVSNEAIGEPSKQDYASKSSTSNRIDHSSRSSPLKPTANQFTPSVGSSLNIPTYDMLPALADKFTVPMQPVTATVLVQDPMWPGVYREVSGLLKMGSTPIIGYVAAENSPMGENLALGSTSVNTLSPLAAPGSTSRLPLSPLGPKDKNVQDVQQDVQQRLQKSLAQRRFSGSLGSGGF